MFCKAIKAVSLEEAIEKLKKSNIKDCLSMGPEYQIFVNGNKTMVVDKYGRMGVSKCHPDDEFDISTGFKVALNNLEANYHRPDYDERCLLLLAKELGCEWVMRSEESDLLMLYDQNRNIDLTLESDNRLAWLKDEKEYTIENLLER